MAFSGFPLLAASCLAYLSFALRCWGVWAYIPNFQRIGPDKTEGESIRTIFSLVPEDWKCRKGIPHVVGSRDQGSSDFEGTCRYQTIGSNIVVVKV